jgi:hypothetical protein
MDNYLQDNCDSFKHGLKFIEMNYWLIGNYVRMEKSHFKLIL